MRPWAQFHVRAHRNNLAAHAAAQHDRPAESHDRAAHVAHALHRSADRNRVAPDFAVNHQRAENADRVAGRVARADHKPLADLHPVAGPLRHRRAADQQR